MPIIQEENYSEKSYQRSILVVIIRTIFYVEEKSGLLKVIQKCYNLLSLTAKSKKSVGRPVNDARQTGCKQSIDKRYKY
jgi:hypothetical protein